jgi:hypothetical protein
MRPSSRWTYGLWSTRRVLSGVACGVLALGGIGVIFSSPAWAPPFPIHPLTVGNTYVVNTTADGTGVGGCSTGGSCSFRQAVDQYDIDTSLAPSPYLHFIDRGDQITFATTPTCIPNQLNLCGDPIYDIATYGTVVFDNPNGVPVTVTGNGQSITKIDGGGGGDLEILDTGAASVTLSNLTMYGGNSDPSTCGGGIYNDGGNVTVDDSTIQDNLATENGGGICNLDGTFNLNDSLVSSNGTFENGDGGGIYNSGGVFQINGSTISSNGQGDPFEADNGGGIYNSATLGTNAWLFGTTVAGNLAGIDGGGIYNGNFLEVIEGSTVSGNTADTLGGGVYNLCNAFYPGGGVGVTGNTPDNVYQQPCSTFPGVPPGFPGFPGFPQGIGGLSNPVP